MPEIYVICLAAVVIALIAARVIFRWRPAKGAARTISRTDFVLSLVGTLGLALHCLSMFNRGFVDAIPVLVPFARAVNAMGPLSIAFFIIPSALLLIGLRRQHPIVLAVEAVSLITVGLTMYDRGPLSVHLVTIFVSVALITLIGTQFLSAPPRRPGAPRRPRPA